MSALFTDTRSEAEDVQIELLRQAPPWRKLELVEDIDPFAHGEETYHVRF